MFLVFWSSGLISKKFRLIRVFSGSLSLCLEALTQYFSICLSMCSEIGYSVTSSGELGVYLKVPVTNIQSSVLKDL